jgi:hypothetical protein
MKLVKLLSNVVTESVNPKIILEVSEKIKKQLLSKFKSQTKDTDEVILSNVEYFERIKNNLPSDKRDIMRYSYPELLTLVKSKKTLKDVNDTFKMFKKKESGIENKALKDNIKKFMDIKPFLPKMKDDISKYDFLTLVKLNNDYWETTIRKEAFKHFQTQGVQINDEALLYYINSYIENFERLPENTPSVLSMSFTDLEHTLDNIEAKDQGISGKKDYSGVEVIYDKDGLLIFQPKTKDQCIKLRNGRSWCTSREGGGNLYYNYRLENNLTLYYVIDQNKEFNDLNYGVVILVDEYGRKRLADGSNSGRYAGSTVIPWSEISEKVEKLSDKEALFEPKPLSSDEMSILRMYRNKRVGDDPIKELGGEQETEMWLEMNSPTLTPIQYKNLTKELKKKYIALGQSLNKEQIESSEPEVIKYYLSKRMDEIVNSKVSNLSQADIALLNLPTMRKVKEDLKPRFMQTIMSDSGVNTIDIDYPKSDAAKFIVLYGFDELFNSLPDTLSHLIIKNSSGDSLSLDLPSSIGRFKNLEGMVFTNLIKTLPENMGELQNLTFLSLQDNPNLVSLPDSVLKMGKLSFVNVSGTSNPKLPKGFENEFVKSSVGGLWIRM